MSEQPQEYVHHLSVSPERAEEIDRLLASIGITDPVNSYELFHQALTHSSYTYENKLSSLDNYERLEFLGDAVLKIIVSEYIFDRFPEYREGDLTKIRAVIVSDARLSEIAKLLHIGDYMIFGYSEARSGGANKVSNLACGIEALLGALFLDGKMSATRNWLINLLEEHVTEVDLSKTKDNYKAVLQEMTQAETGSLPHYKTVKETGPSHNRMFYIEVSIHGEVIGYGSGKSKKEAQQSAAKTALEAMNALEEPREAPLIPKSEHKSIRLWVYVLM